MASRTILRICSALDAKAASDATKRKQGHGVGTSPASRKFGNPNPRKLTVAGLKVIEIHNGLNRKVPVINYLEQATDSLLLCLLFHG